MTNQHIPEYLVYMPLGFTLSSTDIKYDTLLKTLPSLFPAYSCTCDLLCLQTQISIKMISNKACLFIADMYSYAYKII